MRGTLPDLTDYPHLAPLCEKLLSLWPQHSSYVIRSLNQRTESALRCSDRASDLILRLAKGHSGGLDHFCLDYRYLCETLILQEELHFRRTGRYRLSTLEDARREVYDNGPLMARYMDGLLLSIVLWANHANALEHYITRFLAGNTMQFTHLEVGPGHGLMIYFAAKDPRCVRLTGWDISSTSINSTRRCLDRLGVAGGVSLIKRGLPAADIGNDTFDSIVISEVLEHLERPQEVVDQLYDYLNPGGRIWFNIPVNSPAPDHIYLFREPEEIVALVRRGGFEIEDYAFFPMTGATEERARREKLTISVAVIGRRPR